MEFQTPEHFSDEEKKAYEDNFKALVPQLLKSRGGLNLENILEGAKQGFTSENQTKLYKERNRPMTRYLLIRALRKLEEDKSISFDGREYKYNSNPKA